MTDSTPKFDPIPRLQQIAATIRERGAYTFDAPATAAYYIECAIKEIERLRKERDEARREILESLHPDVRKSYAAAREWDCFKDNPCPRTQT